MSDLCRVPVGTVDAVLSYCHNNLADNTLTSLLDYFHEKKVVVIRCRFSRATRLLSHPSQSRARQSEVPRSIEPCQGLLCTRSC